jgi:hypothetical protein
MTGRPVLAIGLLGAFLAVSGCSDRAFVANAAAARIYWEDRYERVCVAQVGPSNCKDAREALLLLEHHEPAGCDPALGPQFCSPKGLIPVAQSVQKLGHVPKEEKAEILAAIKKAKI